MRIRRSRTASPGAWSYLLAGRPLLPLAVVWLTTAGHTMNFREMGIGKGWVAADVYSLHSLYLVSIALVLLACPCHEPALLQPRLDPDRAGDHGRRLVPERHLHVTPRFPSFWSAG